jgi:uncharacterized membrane protein (DUF485 family)
MAGHGPAVKMGKDNASPYKQSLGIKLFIAYALVYTGFVVINTIMPKMMEKEIALGQNLAVVYGMGLIVLAIVMGLIYNHMCTKKEDELNTDDQSPVEGGAE